MNALVKWYTLRSVGNLILASQLQKGRTCRLIKSSSWLGLGQF